jgi:hypothetical protein
MPEDMSDRMPGRMPEDMPEDMPDKMPENLPEDMPNRMPDRMPEDMSDRKPEDLPVRKCINVMVGITRSKVFFSRQTCDLRYSCLNLKYPELTNPFYFGRLYPLENLRFLVAGVCSEL